MLTFAVASVVNAQTFEEGNKIISIGYGTPNLGKSILKTYETNEEYKVKGLGPLHAKFEYGITDKIGIGLSINHVNYSATWVETNSSNQSYDYKFARNSTAFNARLNFHFGESNVIDPYFGFGLGYKTTSNKWTTNDPTFENVSLGGLFPLGFETTFGIRAYFTPNIGAFAEVGVAKSVIQGGLCFKIE